MPYIPKQCIHVLSWCQKTLVLPNPSRSLSKLPDVNLDIWVDVSTSWGIGLIIGPCWAAGKLLSGWKSNG